MRLRSVNILSEVYQETLARHRAIAEDLPHEAVFPEEVLAAHAVDPVLLPAIAIPTRSFP